jgi:hypothetical protein
METLTVNKSERNRICQLVQKLLQDPPDVGEIVKAMPLSTADDPGPYEIWAFVMALYGDDLSSRQVALDEEAKIILNRCIAFLQSSEIYVWPRSTTASRSVSVLLGAIAIAIILCIFGFVWIALAIWMISIVLAIVYYLIYKIRDRFRTIVNDCDRMGAVWPFSHPLE